eukprot:6867734-Pyramimonas_sp.AAC.1
MQVKISYWSTKPPGTADYSGVIIEGSEMEPPDRMQFEEEAYDDDEAKQALLEDDLEDDDEDDETDSEGTSIFKHVLCLQ